MVAISRSHSFPLKKRPPPPRKRPTNSQFVHVLTVAMLVSLALTFSMQNSVPDPTVTKPNRKLEPIGIAQPDLEEIVNPKQLAERLDVHDNEEDLDQLIPGDICSTLTRTRDWWGHLSNQVLESSYTPLDLTERRQIRKLKRSFGEEAGRFRDWVHGLWRYFDDTRKWPRSTMMPADPRAMKRVLDGIRNNETIRIWVSGGSVTAGHECRALAKDVLNPEKQAYRRELRPRGNQADHGCAWPARLEKHLNALLPVNVEVTNLAVGGVNSETAAMALEYGLLHKNPTEVRPPHIILLSHAVNDVRDPNITITVEEHLPHLIQVAKNLPGNSLPILIDDFTGPKPGEDELLWNSAHLAGDLYALASWHQIPAIALSPMMRHSVLANAKDEVEDPLLSGPITLHGGMGMHVSMAWAVAFNLMQGIKGACEMQTTKQAVALKRTMRRPHEEPDSKFIPAWKRDMTPAKYAHEYQAKASSTEERSSSTSCMYGWMVSDSSGVILAEDVQSKMEPHLIGTPESWKAMGTPTSRPRPGWWARGTGAKFEMEFKVTEDTEYLALVVMRSSGRAFLKSKLRIDMEVTSFSSNETKSSTANVSGYHNAKTSIHVPFRTKLPAKVQAGDVIRLKFLTTGGKSFEINGMALCKR